MTQTYKRWQRVVIGILVPLGAVVACAVALSGRGPGCIFQRFTGLYCPGCGSGRAVAAVFHGNLRAAIAYNPMLFLLGIPAVVVFFHEYLRLVFPRLGLRPVTVPQRAAVGCAVILCGFWVLRNIPVFSFLAPVG